MEAENDVSEEMPEEPVPEEPKAVTWQSLGLTEALCKVCERLNWKQPTGVQQQAIPLALQDKDIIGLAKTGSGKTAAFALPILQKLLENPQKRFALIIAPTRELAFQISDQFVALGSDFGLRTAVIVGGVKTIDQALMLGNSPHVIIATPGRLLEHLKETKGFNLKSLKYLVLDEADRILNQDFERDIDEILKQLPRERRTMLFSATMTKRVKKLQRVSMKNPVKLKVSDDCQTVATLQQYYLDFPMDEKEVHLVHLINEMVAKEEAKSFVVFCATCKRSMRVALVLRHMGFTAIPLHGKMAQDKRLQVLEKFKAQDRSILVSTDVASRGLDIPHVDVVINMDIPTNPKDYIHRVGRTARAGRAGKAISFVTQFDLEHYLRIEAMVGKKFPKFEIDEDDVTALKRRVEKAQQSAKEEFNRINKNMKAKRKRARNDDEDDVEGAVGVRKRLKNTGKQGNKKKH